MHYLRTSDFDKPWETVSDIFINNNFNNFNMKWKMSFDVIQDLSCEASSLENEKRLDWDFISRPFILIKLVIFQEYFQFYLARKCSVWTYLNLFYGYVFQFLASSFTRKVCERNIQIFGTLYRNQLVLLKWQSILRDSLDWVL